jgi:hypothetical protein
LQTSPCGIPETFKTPRPRRNPCTKISRPIWNPLGPAAAEAEPPKTPTKPPNWMSGARWNLQNHSRIRTGHSWNLSRTCTGTGLQGEIYSLGRSWQCLLVAYWIGLLTEAAGTVRSKDHIQVNRCSWTVVTCSSDS